MRGRLLLLTAGLALCAPAARCQNRASNWRVYNVSDGLPENTCSSVSIGPRKVWVGHPDVKLLSGLDGYDATRTACPEAYSGRIYESPGQLWLASPDGLREYRDGNWRRYPVAEIDDYFRASPPAARPAVPLHPIGLGRVFFLLPDALMQFDAENATVWHTNALHRSAANEIGRFLGMATSPRNGWLWISGEHGLAHVGPKHHVSEWTNVPVPVDIPIQNLRAPVEDEEGGVTAVAESTVNRRQVIVHYNAQGWQSETATIENLQFAWRGQDNTRWAATDETLYRLEPATGEWAADEDILPRRINDVAVEADGLFWLATAEGLYRYSPPAWRAPEPELAHTAPVNAVTGDVQGNLWFTVGNALHSLADNVNTSFGPAVRPGQSLVFEHAIFVLPDSNRTVALETADGLLLFDPRSSKYSPVPVPARMRMKPIGRLRDGTVCVQLSSTEPGKESSSLAIFDGVLTNAFPYAQPPPDLGNELRLVVSASGNLWLAGAKNVARYRDGKWQIFSTPPSERMPDGFSSLVEINEDKIWCGFQDKISECDGKTWRLVRGGFDHVNAMLNTRDGGVWVASNNGLHRYYHEAWNVVGQEDGLPSDTVYSVYEDARGQIWAGTAGGLCLYHPEADQDPPRTVITSSAQADNTIREGSPLDIYLRVQDKWKFTPSGRLLSRYRLNGQEWQPYQELRGFPLRDLRPDRYFVEVETIDRNWNVEANPATYEFTVRVPWYKDRQTLLISAAGLTLAMFFAALAFNRHRRLVHSYAEVEAKVALRTKQLEIASQELLHSQKMNALGTLAAGIAHDFNNILSIIKGSAQIIEDNLDNREKISVRTSRIKTVVEQGAGIVKAMLGFTRSTGGELVMCQPNTILEETVKLLGDRFLREVEVQFKPVPGLPEVPASPEFVQQIMLNFIFNSAEAMAGRRQIILSARAANQLPATVVLAPAHAAAYVMISVQDFGSGIPPDIMPRIFEPFFTTKSLSARRGTGLGLSMVYELARQMQAGLAVESELGKGSVFSLIVPVRDLPVDAGARKD